MDLDVLEPLHETHILIILKIFAILYAYFNHN